MYAQVISDAAGRTLAAASTLSRELRETLSRGTDREAAHKVGLLLAAAMIFQDLRQLFMQLEDDFVALAGRAVQIVDWDRNHQFCGRCGAKTETLSQERGKKCPQCGLTSYPRLSPSIIVRVRRGAEILLARSPRWPAGRYSIIAGFVEPGETLEAAVRREVFEETQIRVGPVRYLASQPWPFPASLMIGCLGEAESHEITIDPKEIEDAIWVSREEMAQAFAGDHPKLKPARAGSIAQFLLRKWLADQLD